MKIYLLICTALLLSSGLQANGLLKTQHSWDDGDIYYPEGKAEISVIKLKLDAGQTTEYHCHPVPTIGYVLEGEAEVETKSGKKTRLKKGDSVVEVMKTLHRGKAINGPVEILVVYAGSTSMPNTASADNDKYCIE